MATKKITKKEVIVKSHKRKLEGVISSDKMEKTVVVKVTTRKRHPIYKKVIKSWKKYKADTNGLDVKEGDSVIIQESRQLSKHKKWIVLSKQENVAKKIKINI